MAHRFARNLRPRLMGEHLDRAEDEVDDLIDPVEAFHAVQDSAADLLAWHRAGGKSSERPAAGLSGLARRER